jgi:hypothetical protein
MTDQLYIADSGDIESQPVTWDGEPLYSPATIAEGLFDPSAFEQMPGQTAIDWTDSLRRSTDSIGRGSYEAPR